MFLPTAQKWSEAYATPNDRELSSRSTDSMAKSTDALSTVHSSSQVTPHDRSCATYDDICDGWMYDNFPCQDIYEDNIVARDVVAQLTAAARVKSNCLLLGNMIGLLEKIPSRNTRGSASALTDEMVRRNCRGAERVSAHSNTMPPSNVVDAQDALLNKPIKLLVASLSSSKPTSSPYSRLVASRNPSSFFMLVIAEQSRSRHRNVELCSRFSVSGIRILPISAMVKGTSDREMYPIWASH
ncbi:unnamed protein product [Fusarium graminearum]|uniref:Chromosome 1, complete genome n=1 Tax=Gibberella zeae (strain ATCC MYA-4620 / CBS 123657 / FGSC 9075 / NRRL 31084 / PH-1) TaxID=229533 RepID=I1S5C0_GIBZE|nr:hypothetical protein FGSG_12038 [Fusarium graminearum PH-1]ESU07332.1 hypothetical protein FGSG_12038 [Fusarium graminearum PH-1]EYB34516.1 hypothetical protein FG05_12038 [Fusarium graminearum]CEF74173.1 unnamed protein product [Fusarium graminearum]CZS77440.1 unnamed protein product [Fusarium graminearum]|eukprot:XP_011317817.1 hypothetical protein FGSG_12038 [Fusarium graminearum PH-1]